MRGFDPVVKPSIHMQLNGFKVSWLALLYLVSLGNSKTIDLNQLKQLFLRYVEFFRYLIVALRSQLRVSYIDRIHPKHITSRDV